jgi:hypothetical protein
VISDFRVMSDQRELFGLVASVPTAWRTLAEIARGGARADRWITQAVNTARRHAWAQIVARHGALPGVRLADKTLDGVTCIRLDATVTFACSDKELAEANFKGYGHFSELENDHEVWAGCGCSAQGGVWLRAGIPSPTGVGVRVRRSIWASLSWAPTRLILSPSASPSHPSRLASAMQAVRLSRISAMRFRWADLASAWSTSGPIN